MSEKISNFAKIIVIAPSCLFRNRYGPEKKNLNHMKKIALSIIALCSLFAGAKAEDKVLLTIDGEPVMQSEFLYIYNKNNQETAIDQKTIDEYMDLFINFKLKVKEAEEQGIDTTEVFKQELASYRKQALPKYLHDSLAEEGVLRMSYEHMLTDRRAAHITIECPASASDSAVEAALARINDARVRVTTGRPVDPKANKQKKGRKAISAPEDFFMVAQEVSTDPSVAETRGELGWITPFRYVWPLEKAVYETPVGQVSEVFRTQYGFHIVLVEEEIPHIEVHARHIMKVVPQGNDSMTAVAKEKIFEVYEAVKNGADFAATAQAESDDKGSAMRGGDLGWFGKGMMVKPFEDAAFALEPGQLSEPFLSRFGWHFIYMEERRNGQPYEQMKEDLRKRVARDERNKEIQKKHIANVRAEYNLPAEMSDEQVLRVEDENLENKYEDLRHLIQEYHDGILLFDVSLKEVWDKASLDTLGLTEFFKQNKKNYTWDEPRFKGRVIYCKDQNTLKAAKAICRSANKDSIGSYLIHRLNTDSTTFVRYEKGVWKKGQKPAIDKLQWKEGDWEADKQFPYVFLDGKVIKAPEEYMDERSKVTSDYQDQLEKAWIERLRAKHVVKINQDVLEEIKAINN